MLVVDDDTVMARLMSRVLTDAGHEVAVALHPAEALAFVVDRVPDAVITDFEMPAMNGAELMERLGDLLRTSTPPAVLVSGALDAVHPRQRELFVEVLSKPFRPDELRTAAARCLEVQGPRRKRSGTRMRAVATEQDATKDEIQGG